MGWNCLSKGVLLYFSLVTGSKQIVAGDVIALANGANRRSSRTP